MALSNRTDGCVPKVCPLWADADGSVTIPNCVAGSVTTTEDDVTPVRPVEEKLSVNVPAPVMPRPVKVAMPDEFVDAVEEPTSDAPPPVTAAVMLTPD